MSSVNTNIGAIVAQKYLRATTMDMNIVQNRVSSGLRVASALDDASSFAVGAGMRADIKSYTAAAGALQGAKVGAQVAVAAGETIARRLEDVKAKIVQMADESLSTASRNAYQSDLDSMIAEVNNYLSQAEYNGTNLLGSGGADVLVVANIDASVITMRNQDVSDLDTAGAVGAVDDSAAASEALSQIAAFKASLDTALAELGADLKQIDSQTEFVKQTEETVKIGLGALVDADLAKESANLQSLQVRQQLGVQAIGIANQAPQALLGLFR
ncbi:MAG: flagellin [Alphaproteobacteria bacterium]|nr:flagellin [Alphaproteobacteria bacterium]